jgi:hypothetical protein
MLHRIQPPSPITGTKRRLDQDEVVLQSQVPRVTPAEPVAPMVQAEAGPSHVQDEDAHHFRNGFPLSTTHTLDELRVDDHATQETYLEHGQFLC